MSWDAEAECLRVGAPVELFFPDSNKPDASQVEEAKAICRVCPVQEQCLNTALTQFTYIADSGIWGGTTRAERRVLRKQLNFNR